MKSLVFASRNFKEIIRDPLSWVFCMGFPLVMLALMSVINASIPKEAGMKLFEIPLLAPGIAVFGYTFIMLFACMLVSGDRADAFLLRVFTSPMKPSDYIIGYIIPLIVLAVGQSVITGIVSVILGAVQGTAVNFGYMLASVLFSLPAIIMFVSFGLLFGTLCNKNAAPGICSIIISLGGMLGGIWMDVDAIGGTLAKICNALPFVHAVNAARSVYAGDLAGSLSDVGIICVWAAVITVIAVVCYNKKMKF